MPEPEGLQATVHRLTKSPANLVEAERRSLGGPVKIPSPHPVPAGPRGGAIPRLEGVPGRIQSVLERKGQVILYGPQGTGKTFWVEFDAGVRIVDGRQTRSRRRPREPPTSPHAPASWSSRGAPPA